MIEIDGQVVEDAAWLRKRTDFLHINFVELDTTIKGIEERTDSTTTLNWIRAAVTEHRRVKTKATAEMIILRRASILKELIAEFELSLCVALVQSTKNKADVLIRDQKNWMKILDDPDMSIVTACFMTYDEVKEHHSMHYTRID